MHNNLRTVRLKYLLGEFVLGIWHPKMYVLNPDNIDPSDWPPDTKKFFNMLTPGADGVLCHHAPASFFPPGIIRINKFIRYVTHIDVLYSVAVHGSFQEYLKKFSSKARQNLTRSVRKFSDRQESQAAYEVYTEPHQMAVFYAEASAISRQTYQARLLKAGFPENESFITEMCDLASRGMARGYLLRDRGKAIAFAWCTGKGTCLTYNTIGYLPSEASQSPGTILLYHILDDVFSSSKFSVIDFGNGEAQYKSMFATDRKEIVSVYFFRMTFRIVVLVWLHWWMFRFSDFSGHLLDRFGLKAKIKKMLRNIKS